MATPGNPYHDNRGRFTNAPSGKSFNIGFGTHSTDENDDVKDFPTEQELDEYRKERQIEQNRQEAIRLNEEEKARDAAKKQRKQPRKAMSKKYNLGDTITIDGNNYKVRSVVDIDGKLGGYMVYVGNELKFLDIYGKIRNDVPTKRWKL